jgi:hypothetical protein
MSPRGRVDLQHVLGLANRPWPAPAAGARSRRTRPSSRSASRAAASSTCISAWFLRRASRRRPGSAASSDSTMLAPVAARLTPILSRIGRHDAVGFRAAPPAGAAASIRDCPRRPPGSEPLNGLLGFDRQFVESKCHDEMEKSWRRALRRGARHARAETAKTEAKAQSSEARFGTLRISRVLRGILGSSALRNFDSPAELGLDLELGVDGVVAAAGPDPAAA